MDIEQVEALERIARLMQQGVLSESEGYEARLQILGEPEVEEPVDDLENTSGSESVEDKQSDNRNPPPRWVVIVLLFLIAGGITAAILLQGGKEAATGELRSYTSPELLWVTEHIDTPKDWSPLKGSPATTELQPHESNAFCGGPNSDKRATDNSVKAYAASQHFEDSTARWYWVRLYQFASEDDAQSYIAEYAEATECGTHSRERIEGDDIDRFVEADRDGTVWRQAETYELSVLIAPKHSDDSVIISRMRTNRSQYGTFQEELHFGLLVERHGNLIIELTKSLFCCIKGFSNSDEFPSEAGAPIEKGLEAILNTMRESIFSALTEVDLGGAPADI
jgi:hypothetical protein